MGMEEHKLGTTVPVPDLGPDIVLRFRTADLIAVEKLAGQHKEGASWLAVVEDRVYADDSGFIIDALKLGLKQADDATTPFTKIDWKDVPVPIETLKRPLVDALFRAVRGVSYAEVLERITPAITTDEAA